MEIVKIFRMLGNNLAYSKIARMNECCACSTSGRVAKVSCEIFNILIYNAFQHGNSAPKCSELTEKKAQMFTYEVTIHNREPNSARLRRLCFSSQVDLLEYPRDPGENQSSKGTQVFHSQEMMYVNSIRKEL